LDIIKYNMLSKSTDRTILTIFMLLVLISSLVLPAISTEDIYEDEKDMGFGSSTEKIEEILEDENEELPRLYVPYKEEYNTRNYEGWEKFYGEEDVIVANDTVVVRRGTTLNIKGDTGAESDIEPLKDDMDELSIDERDQGWEVDIPEENTIGGYRFELSNEDWTEEIEIYVIYDPEEFGIPEEKLKAYAYDEDGTRDEKGFIYTSGDTVHPGREDLIPNLHPFGDDYDDRPSIYEFALAGAGNTTDPQESAARFQRIVAQRNDARPEFQPLIRDASDILFYGEESPSFFNDNHRQTYRGSVEKEDDLSEGEIPQWLRDKFDEVEIELSEEAEISESMDDLWVKEESRKIYRIEEEEIEQEGESTEILEIFEGLTQTFLDEEVKEVEGLTLEDAEKLALNGVSMHDLESEDRSKVINGWCDEVSFAMVALLRSIGIPSRVASIHPTPEVQEDLMEHYFVEIWLEESMYDVSWEEETNEGDWYVLDPDEWGVRFPSGIEGEPDFFMPMGETFASRKNYLQAVELLFDGRWETQDIYVFGPGESPEPKRITEKYSEAPEHELEQGSVEKIIGRGGGDFYRIDLDRAKDITIESDDSIEASIYVSNENYPIIPTATEGPHFREPMEYEGGEAELVTDSRIRGEEVGGPYYISIYAPSNGNRSEEGNFGRYTLTVEYAEEEDLIAIDHLFATIILILWIISYIVMKRL